MTCAPAYITICKASVWTFSPTDGWGYRQPSLQRCDADAHHVDQQSHHAAQPDGFAGGGGGDRADVERPPDPVHLGAGAVIILVAFLFGSRIEKGSTRVQDQLAASTVVAEEGCRGAGVKSFGASNTNRSATTRPTKKTFRLSLRMAVYNSGFGSLMMFLGFGSIAAVMWYGGREVIAGG